MKNIIKHLLIVLMPFAALGQTNDTTAVQQNPEAPLLSPPPTPDRAPSKELRKELVATGKRDKQGLKTGAWVEYVTDTLVQFEKVLVKNEGSYLKGKKEGAWKEYKSFDVDTPVHWILNKAYDYKGGLLDGYARQYVDGKVFSESLFSKGIKSSRYVEYYPSGKISKELSVRNDTLDGLQKLYYESGSLSSQAQVSNNIYNGEYLEYFESGKLKRKLYFANDSMNGTSTTYNEQGIVVEEAEMKSNIFNGTYKRFYDNGSLWTIRTYKNGKLWEVVLNQDKNGKKLEPGNLKEGNGTVHIYDENGVLTDVWIVEDGKLKK